MNTYTVLFVLVAASLVATTRPLRPTNEPSFSNLGSQQRFRELSSEAASRTSKKGKASKKGGEKMKPPPEVYQTPCCQICTCPLVFTLSYSTHSLTHDQVHIRSWLHSWKCLKQHTQRSDRFIETFMHFIRGITRDQDVRMLTFPIRSTCSCKQERKANPWKIQHRLHCLTLYVTYVSSNINDDFSHTHSHRETKIAVHCAREDLKTWNV